MRRVIIYTALTLLTTALAIAALVFWWLNYSHRPTPESFQAKIAEYNQLIQAEIPEGSSSAQVMAFLGAHKIQHSELMTGLEDLDLTSDYRELALPRKDEIIKGYMHGILRDVDYGPLISWSVTMHFYFDRQDRLVAHSVKWVGTGL
ncbi:MAG: hypothetical protein QOD75_3998 [Blastocatellia bacterium]|jgi:hypothetical protein|nr:hypothetical protein [Blastocatellia bacterium]